MNKIYYIDIKKLQASFTYEELYNMVSLYRKNKVNRLKLDKDNRKISERIGAME